jgi:hypothetical protein
MQLLKPSSKRSAKASEEQVRIAEETLNLQKKKEQEEEIRSKQANIVLELKGEYLFIENRGDASASNVTLSVQSGDKNTFMFLKDNYYIPEHSSVEVKLNISKLSRPPWDIKITWDDEYKKGNEKVQKLN